MITQKRLIKKWIQGEKNVNAYKMHLNCQCNMHLLILVTKKLDFGTKNKKVGSGILRLLIFAFSTNEWSQRGGGASLSNKREGEDSKMGPNDQKIWGP